MEQQDVGALADESERRVVAPHQGDLTGLRPEWSELEVAVEVREQPSGTRGPPVHRDHESVLALVGFGEIHLDRLPETGNAEQRGQTEREPLAVPVRCSGALSDDRTRVCAYPSPDLVKVDGDLHEVLDEHFTSQHLPAGRRRTEDDGVDSCDQRPAYTEAVATTRVRVLLCDDHELVRRGLRSLLESDLTIDVIGEASSADEAVSASAATEPDVVVMDVRMP